ncbi:hypothetical protein G7077_03615 [Sphingomonas piscis]|uniref:Uncharacterized protein n=1 Tax=Sphingomonas piscis TaxID=2714943 RepID=A0A6G7YN13_9SPHN|nr:hypothetical protein [Sphingomonas piscis]QIK78135.1 hypothetical protein G7077_03615 [Sphingomonas piscis]
MNAVGELLRVKESADRGEARRDLRIVAALSAASLVYATVRYNVFKGVPWADWPSLIVNKAVGLSALLLILAGVQAMVAGRSPRRLLAWAGGGVLLHVAVSLAILEPGYFPGFFVGPKMSFAAGLSLLAGAAAAVGMEIGARKSGTLTYRGRALALGAIAAASGFHAGVTGLHNWIEPAKWPGGMPPITLLSFVAGCAALALARRVWGKST